MDAAQKQDAAVYRQAKQGMDAVQNAMHPSRVNPVGKHPALYHALHPGMVDILVPRAIGRVLNGPIRKVYQSMNYQKSQRKVFPGMGPQYPPKGFCHAF
ncbi:MAG: hypothetical protein HFF16_03460 [Angelakisella sp.]|nr:hypothetical protein [Angelakisella sp.]MCI9528737.1 hypothetical protein [Angelakisella sp.]